MLVFSSFWLWAMLAGTQSSFSFSWVDWLLLTASARLELSSLSHL